MATSPTLVSVISTRYGITVDQADALVIEWAAEHLAGLVGNEKAAKEWRKLNARRHRAGRYTNIPRFGSKLFTAYFAR